MSGEVVELPEFRSFQKIARLSRLMTVTEKIDGTNGVIYVGDDIVYPPVVVAGSKNRWLSLHAKQDDNFGFARWVAEHREEALLLGPGYHHGEWYGSGIQRGYGLDHKRFALFHPRWQDNAIRPACFHTVPILAQSVPFRLDTVDYYLAQLAVHGSVAVPGADAEGVVVYHEAAKTLFKKTITHDESPKGTV